MAALSREQMIQMGILKPAPAAKGNKKVPYQIGKKEMIKIIPNYPKLPKGAS